MISGGDFGYVVTVYNNGPYDATDVIFTIALPADVAFVGSTATCGTPSGNTVTCTTLSIAAGQGVQHIVTVTAPDKGGPITAVANITGLPMDTNLVDNTRTVVLNAQGPDLELTTSVAESSVVAGEDFTYQMDVENVGNATASNVVVTTTLAADVAVVSSAAGCEPPASGVISCVAATLTAGASESYSISVGTPLVMGPITSSVVAIADGFGASTVVHDSGAVTSNVAGADLTVAASLGSESLRSGLDVTYTVTVVNNGPATAHGVTAVATLPPELIFVSAGTGCGVAVAGAVSCTTATLVSGAFAEFTLTVRAPTSSGLASTTFNVVQAAPGDPSSTNDTFIFAVPVVPALSAWVFGALVVVLAALGLVLRLKPRRAL